MKNKISIQNLRTVFIVVVFISGCLIFSKAKAQNYNAALAKKYGLTISPPNEKLEPAPKWLQEANMVTNTHSIWKGYKFNLIDTVMTRIVRRRAGNGPAQKTEQYLVETIDYLDGSSIKGVPLISHLPHNAQAFKEAHEQGFRVTPYVHFKDIHAYYADQDVFMFQHPEILLNDKDGQWAHLRMDGTNRMYRYLTCANSPSYWKLSLDYVKKLMDMGADGVFVDNVSGQRAECYAPKFDKSPGDPRKNPEFESYVHEHLFPEATQTYAFDRMLQAIKELVKSYGEDKIVTENTWLDKPDYYVHADMVMWESFIYSWAWKGRSKNATWDIIKKRAGNISWFLNSGKQVTALSSIGTGKDAKDDAFWAFSACNLLGMKWWAGINGSGAEALYQVQLGKAFEPFKEVNKIAYKIFDNGLIVLNDGEGDQPFELILPNEFKKKTHLLDVYNNSDKIQIKKGKVKVSVPSKMARVYLFN